MQLLVVNEAAMWSSDVEQRSGAGGGVEQAERRDGSAGARLAPLPGKTEGLGRDGTARGGARRRDGSAMARRRRLAVVRAGATRRLKTEEQRWCTALGRLAQATTMVETRLAGAAAWL
ncbi:hypothetical protein U1Q18_014111 [Sarracenia purpurea var. burkii]